MEENFKDILLLTEKKSYNSKVSTHSRHFNGIDGYWSSIFLTSSFQINVP